MARSAATASTKQRRESMSRETISDWLLAVAIGVSLAFFAVRYFA
jgi:hypothetical protein